MKSEGYKGAVLSVVKLTGKQKAADIKDKLTGIVPRDSVAIYLYQLYKEGVLDREEINVQSVGKTFIYWEK